MEARAGPRLLASRCLSRRKSRSQGEEGEDDDRPMHYALFPNRDFNGGEEPDVETAL